MVPKFAENRLGVILGPKFAQAPQDGSKMAPRCPKTAPSCSKMPQDGHKMAPRCAKMGPRRAQDSPKIRQDGPKMAPRWLSWAVLGSIGPPWAFLECSSCSAKIALQLLLNTFGERPPAPCQNSFVQLVCLSLSKSVKYRVKLFQDPSAFRRPWGSPADSAHFRTPFLV